jgi:Tol biopolymer transport system component/mono/diheme cytochrome c family protein
MRDTDRKAQAAGRRSPATRASAAASQAKPATMRSWQVLAIAAVLIAGVAIGGWLLGRNTRPLATGVAQTAKAGDLSVTMRVDEAALGPRVIDLTVDNAAGQPVDIGGVRLRFAMTDMNMGNTEINAQAIGAGHFQARGQFFTMAGNWAVEATLLRDGQAPLQVPFTMAIAAPGEASGPINPLKGNTQAILSGQKLYLTNCVPCHGATGKGDGPAGIGLNPRPGDFTQHMVTGKHTDGQVFLWIKNGYPNSAMPVWDKRLTEEQIWQLVTYLRTFGQTTPAAKPTAQAAIGGATPQPQAQQPQQFSAPVPNAQEPLPPLIFARQGNIWRSDGNGDAPRPITKLESDAYAEYPIFSPDDSKIAFITITPAPVTATVPLPSSTLLVMNADGAELRTVWKPAQGLLGIPTWSADGQALYVAANGVQAGQGGNDNSRQLQIVRIDLMSGKQQPLLNDALDPSISRDGKQLAYLKLSEDGYTMSLNIAAPDGSGPRELIGGQDFQGFYAPRFSPDGKQVVVAAIGGPETDAQGNPVKASAPSALDRLLGLLEPPTAEAHGLPWDLWVVNTDGTGLRRMTSFYEDLPMASFSPDGKQIAVMGLGGIYLMDADGTRLRRIDQTGDHGGLDWPRK